MSNTSTSKIKIQVQNNPVLNNDMYVKAIVQGEKFVDATHIARPVYAHTKKISKDKYVLLRDCTSGCAGEIKTYKKKDTQQRQRENLQRTFNHIRWLIRSNFAADADNQLFLTLTYAENMQDRERLMHDFESFFKRLKRKNKGHKLDYITVAEPQERGAWHLHVMLKSDQPVLILPNKEVCSIWGHGFTTTKRLKSDDVGTYYVAYFTDLLEEQSEKDKPKSKRRKKGARLGLYPKNFKFYRKSKGIIEPQEKKVKISTLKCTFGEPCFSRTYTVTNVENKPLNTITKINFKKKNGEM